MRPAALLAALLLAAAVPALAGAGDSETTAATTTPSPLDPLEAQGAIIGKIEIRILDVFDLDNPEENRRLFRLANKLHRTTRPGVIEKQLLFTSGEPFSRRLLEESERILRSKRYLSDATIRPLRVDGTRVDLEVATHDVWTLKVGASVGRSGGVNTTRFQLQDSNFLGTGKNLALYRRSSVDRTSSSLRYDDLAVRGTRFQLGFGFESNSDGDRRDLEIARPFFALDTRWALGLAASSDDRVDSLYTLGHAVDRFRHREDLVRLEAGISRGLRAGWARRWSLGFAFERDRFAAVAESGPLAELPADRELSYPWIAFETLQDDYRKERNLDQLFRTEDLHLGGKVRAEVGYSSTALGADRDRFVARVEAARGFGLPGNSLMRLATDLALRTANGELENSHWAATVRYYRRDFGDQLFFATFEGTLARKLDPEVQLMLGGDNGLRGYPLRYQDGNARALLTLEQRYFSNWYPWRLVHVGGAAFFDAGRTWPGGGPHNLGLLKDVGIGLRFTSDRSGLGEVLHVDAAFPLDGDRSIQSLQWLVGTKRTF